MKKGLKKYSLFSLVRNALSYHQNWQEAWRSPEPKKAYDIVIIGAGGHGLATAYYLAKEHGITNVVVLEKGWLGVAATPGVTRPLFARTISGMRAPTFMNIR